MQHHQRGPGEKRLFSIRIVQLEREAVAKFSPGVGEDGEGEGRKRGRRENGYSLSPATFVQKLFNVACVCVRAPEKKECRNLLLY